MFAKSDKGAKAEPFYKWDAKSTYIQNHHIGRCIYGMPALKNLRPLGVFPK